MRRSRSRNISLPDFTYREDEIDLIAMGAHGAVKARRVLREPVVLGLREE